jgi:hypothetical protein
LLDNLAKRRRGEVGQLHRLEAGPQASTRLSPGM